MRMTKRKKYLIVQDEQIHQEAKKLLKDKEINLSDFYEYALINLIINNEEIHKIDYDKALIEYVIHKRKGE